MPRNLAPAALGFRVHSGWAAVVAVSGPLTSPAVIERRRIEIAAPEIPGSKQPYHAAEKLGLKEAEQFLLRCHQSSVSLARKAIGDCIHDANRKGQNVARCGILFASGRPLGTLAAILASHALIHTAEGEFFRNVVLDACKHHEVQAIRVKEKELLPHFENEIHISQEALNQHLSSIGRIIGSPWRQDERFAMMVAWLALAAAGRTSN
ncbi:MAG TPA: hypothetical protein VII95_18025 [Terriglobales bacterium]|jgi:hypothetical protein